MPDGTTPRFTEESLAPFSFTEAFALFFPSVTGIMAGSNRSGDLANAQSSIPRGTIAATLVTSLLYLLTTFMYGAVASRDVLAAKNSVLLSAVVSWPHEYIVRVGIVLSTLGAGLQSMTGAPRLLQAIANDNLIPALRPFRGSGEPRLALGLCIVIIAGCIAPGSLNFVAPIITMFFLLCYMFVNLACLLQDLLKEPNWRPRFHLYHPVTALLGMRGAKAFEADASLYAEAAAEPSQTMRLIGRLIASRQAAGHARVAVFCESTTQLKILRCYLERQERTVGTLLLFDGALSAAQRASIVRQFLECDKGVLLLSGAGSIGITLCPGCEVLLSVGSLPWNASTIDQAFGRIYRIGQDKPVEIIQFAARRSVTSAKLGLHADKRERLARAAADEDYSQFVDGDKWRETRRILGSCVPLDVRGNYVLSDDQAYMLRQYRRLIERCDANGVPRPAPPPGLPQAPVLANTVALPPVSFRVLE